MSCFSRGFLQDVHESTNFSCTPAFLEIWWRFAGFWITDRIVSCTRKQAKASLITRSSMVIQPRSGNARPWVCVCQPLQRVCTPKTAYVMQTLSCYNSWLLDSAKYLTRNRNKRKQAKNNNDNNDNVCLTFCLGVPNSTISNAAGLERVDAWQTLF